MRVRPALGDSLGMNDRDSLILARLIWLRTPGVGPAKLAELQRTGHLAELLALSEQGFQQLGLSPAAINWLKRPNEHQIAADLAWLQKPNHALIWPDELDYPRLLSEAQDAAPPLFVAGSPDCLHWPTIAVVGARRASAGGIENARWFATELSRAGYTVVSGLAYGVDAEAHRACLQAGGPTVAVLGTGVDVPYPLGNTPLAQDIERQGALISELPLGTSPRPEHFPRRNRIISGLCRATLVVEAGLKSGSLITARLAAEQNREVFAIPGSIHNEHARGCHRLLRDGACLVESPAEIIELLGGLLARIGQPAPPEANARPALLSDAEHQLADAMGFDPVDFDTLQHRTGLTTQAISTMLAALVLKDRVADLGGGRYAWLARSGVGS